ncbi:hypothetical protein F5B20DRAFT_597021 [Whalleya microplaca]|nr:hypothetical protein F5B20DRAFT_597021 [Whalleya microplaca]
MKLSRALIRPGRAVPAIRSSTPQSLSLARTASFSVLTSRSSSSSVTFARNHPRRSLQHSNHPDLLAYTSCRSYASSPSDTADAPPLKKTALYDLHLAHGAKMVPFGGFHMPVQYASQGVSASHLFTRSHASLFDVGHMVQHRFRGPGAAAFLQRVTPASLTTLPPNHNTLSALLWPGTGGIVDDTIITRLGDDKAGFYVVTNAACAEKDLGYLASELEKWHAAGGAGVAHEVLADHGLVALQGPLAAEILEEVVASPARAKIPELYFGQSRYITLKGGKEPVLVSRGGYTGEDGFEISIPGGPAPTVAATEALLRAAGPERLRLAGLGARDSLRLEAGMCLYGHDLDDSTTPVEASLGWIVGKDRRDLAALRAEGAVFHGAETVLAQLKTKTKGGLGVRRHRVGLVVEGAPAREGAEVFEVEAGEKVGVVTSGCPSPSTGKNIAMAYVKDSLQKVGTELEVVVRGKRRAAVVTKMPFVRPKYWRMR